METKHTPGPWYALRGQRNISIRHKTGDKFLPMVNVASVRGKFPADCQYGSSEANARLIAAAPELLAALQALVGWEDAEIKHFGATGPDDWIMEAPVPPSPKPPRNKD